MTAEVLTVATRATPGLIRLQSSLLKFNVPVTILGHGESEYWGHGWRWKTLIRAARNSSADVIIHCDGYDTLCLDSLDNCMTKFATLDHPIVFSYEPQAQPEFWLGLQAGLLMADRKALGSVFSDETLETHFPDHFNDQYQLQSMYSWDPALFKLDTQSVLFHTLGPRSPALVPMEKGLVNPVTGQSPSFVHGPNNCDLSNEARWIANRN